MPHVRADASTLVLLVRRPDAPELTEEEAAELQRRLTEQEHEVVRRLQETDRLKADLVATVSHELRSPLTTVLGVFGILRVRRRRLSPAERDGLVAMGIGQSQRLQRMIEQLLLAARFEQAERGATPFQTARVELDATELVDQAGAEARARHSGRAIAVETNGSLPVRVAQDVVVQVLGNLIDNAYEHGDGRGVEVSIRSQAREIVVAVADQGPGIPPEDVPHLFESFFKSGRSRARGRGGVGMGLPIAYENARLLGGRIAVDSEIGQGTTFTLHLPLHASVPPIDPANQEGP